MGGIYGPVKEKWLVSSGVLIDKIDCFLKKENTTNVEFGKEMELITEINHTMGRFYKNKIPSIPP